MQNYAALTYFVHTVISVGIKTQKFWSNSLLAWKYHWHVHENLHMMYC